MAVSIDRGSFKDIRQVWYGAGDYMAVSIDRSSFKPGFGLRVYIRPVTRAFSRGRTPYSFPKLGVLIDGGSHGFGAIFCALDFWNSHLRGFGGVVHSMEDPTG